MSKFRNKFLIVFALLIVALNITLNTWNRSLKALEVPYLVDTPVDRVAFDKQGQVWVYGGGKLSVYKNGTPIQIFTEKDSPALGGDIRELELDDKGRVWIVTQGKERTVDLAVFDGTQWSTLLPAPESARSTVLQSRLESLGGVLGIHALAIDSQERAWIGTETQIFYTIDDITWEHLPIASKYVNCIVFDNQGRAWIGGDGLYIFDGNAWQTFTTENSPLFYGGIRAIAFDQQGQAWIASGQPHGVGYGGGVSVFDGKDWTIYPDLIVGAFEDIAVDGAGRIWALEEDTREGALVFDGKSWKNHKFSVSDLSGNLTTDNEGNIWIPTQAQGVAFIPADPRKHRSPLANIISLAIASNGLIFLNVLLLGIWLYFVRNAWQSEGLSLANLPTYFALIKERLIKQSVSPKIMARDIAIGFFGWTIFNNVYFLVAFSSIVEAAIFFLGLPLLIVSLILFLMKRFWIWVGIATAILVTFGIWTILLMADFGHTPWYLYLLIPFPTGVYLFMS